MRFVSLLLVTLTMLFANPVAHAAGKVALVIGNGDYIHANPLPNPSNDATDMSAALQALGFTVIGGNNLDFATMGAKIGEFEDAARNADVTLLFYAGHGIQVNGRNFLLPINAKLERESTLQFEAIDSETILNAMSGPGKTAIALLDACRDNPLSRSFSRSLGTRSAAVGQGLATPAIAGGGILIGFATAPGDTAADGDGRNSPFTTAMLKHINTPGLEIQSLMTRVKSDVYASTKEEQQPWHNSSLRSEFYLVDHEKTDAAPQPAAASVESEWNAVKDTQSIAALDAFMAAHADKPVFVALAQERKDALRTDKNNALLDEFLIKKKEPEKTAKDVVKELVLNDLVLQDIVASKTKRGITLSKFFENAKLANEGKTTFALLSVPTVNVPAPPKNPGKKVAALNLKQTATAPTLEMLLSSNGGLAFSESSATTCRLDWIDRCPFIPQSLVATLDAGMAEHGMAMTEHQSNYFNISRLAGTENYILSNSPSYGSGVVAIIAAIITPEGEVRDIVGFELSRERIGVEAGDAASIVNLTWAAAEGDDIYASFDSSYRCTDQPRKFGFLTKFNLADRQVKWVSPTSVSDVNFVVVDNALISANGGSCVDDFAYKIDKETGVVLSRFKTPKAIERMDYSNGQLIFQLYEGAAVYQLE